jgi:hypothetical protein
MRIGFVTPLLLAALGSASVAQVPDRGRSPSAMVRFFSGDTKSEGTLKVTLQSPHTIRVQGNGHVEADGLLVLHQTVEQDGKVVRTREWRIREVSPGRYGGTLSDASGPVTGEISGNELHLAFRMKGGLDAQQWITFAPDARSAHNIMRVTKFGITFARLDETIRKVG